MEFIILLKNSSATKGGVLGKRRKTLQELTIKDMLLLESGHTISDSLSEKIGQVNDEEKLDELLMVAVTAASVEEFEEKLEEILAGQVKSTKIRVCLVGGWK